VAIEKCIEIIKNCAGMEMYRLDANISGERGVFIKYVGAKKENNKIIRNFYIVVAGYTADKTYPAEQIVEQIESKLSTSKFNIRFKSSKLQEFREDGFSIYVIDVDIEDTAETVVEDYPDVLTTRITAENIDTITSIVGE
jgi:hypothetical protein